MFGYRIYTENKGIDRIIKLLDNCGFDGATIFRATGVWKGTAENSVVIEIFSTGGVDDSIREFADKLCMLFEQESVMIQYFQANIEFRS